MKPSWCENVSSRTHTVLYTEASPFIIIVSAFAGCFPSSCFFKMCVYLLLPWDLHSKQGLLFNGTIIKCAVSKHWWFALSPVYSPIRLIPRAAPFPHSAAFLDVNTSKSLAAKHWLKHSWENRNILLVMCGTLFSPPKKYPVVLVKCRRAAGGHISWMFCLLDCKIQS